MMEIQSKHPLSGLSGKGSGEMKVMKDDSEMGGEDEIVDKRVK